MILRMEVGLKKLRDMIFILTSIKLALKEVSQFPDVFLLLLHIFIVGCIF